MSKQSLRKLASEKRKNLDMSRISAVLTEKLVNSSYYKNSTNIMIYYPLDYEVNLLSLLNDKTKQFYLPRINGDALECCKYNIGDELNVSKFHTYEPVCESCLKTTIDLVIVPALLCDKNNNRLGYGGGYYDRFLSDYKGKKISCIPKELFVDTLPSENYDVVLDYIIIG